MLTPNEDYGTILKFGKLNRRAKMVVSAVSGTSRSQDFLTYIKRKLNQIQFLFKCFCKMKIENLVTYFL